MGGEATSAVRPTSEAARQAMRVEIRMRDGIARGIDGESPPRHMHDAVERKVQEFPAPNVVDPHPQSMNDAVGLAGLSLFTSDIGTHMTANTARLGCFAEMLRQCRRTSTGVCYDSEVTNRSSKTRIGRLHGHCDFLPLQVARGHGRAKQRKVDAGRRYANSTRSPPETSSPVRLQAFASECCFTPSARRLRSPARRSSHRYRNSTFAHARGRSQST